MYLSKSERKAIIHAFGYENLAEDNHYQVEPDVWVYLFSGIDNKKYVLISADYLELDFDHFPHLLRFNNNEFHKIDFILQKEIISQNLEKTFHCNLFEHT